MSPFKLPSIILCYHRIDDEAQGGHSKLCVSKRNFEKHLKLLKRLGYDFVDLESIAQISRGSLAITFDDGYADNLTNALPVLREYEAPATVFVSSYYVDQRKDFVADVICNHDGRHFDKVRQIATLSKSEFVTTLDKKIEKEKRCRCSNGRPLTRSELIQLSSESLISLGAHTELHRSLAEIDDSEIEEEILAPIKFLRGCDVNPSNFYALPFGQSHHVDLKASKKVRALGFEPLTTFPLTVQARARERVFGLPRLSVAPGGPVLLALHLFSVIIGSTFPSFWLSLLRLTSRLRHF